MKHELKEMANEWWDGLEETQKNYFLDKWILREYKNIYGYKENPLPVFHKLMPKPKEA